MGDRQLARVTGPSAYDTPLAAGAAVCEASFTWSIAELCGVRDPPSPTVVH